MTSIFLWLPKTGGLSIYDALKPHGIKRRMDMGTFSCEPARFVTYSHVSLKALEQIGMLPYPSWIFTIVRNPYSRAVSLWSYLRLKGMLGPRTDFRTFCHILQQRVIEPIGLYNKRGLSQCRPQADWLRGVYVGYFGRFETLQSDFDNVCNKLKIPRAVLTHRNRGDHRDYREYYDAETQGIVRDYYAEDFELLAYSEEL